MLCIGRVGWTEVCGGGDERSVGLKIFWKLWAEERRNGWGIGKHIVLFILNNQFIVGTQCRREGTRGVNPLSARMAETRGRNTWS